MKIAQLIPIFAAMCLAMPLFTGCCACEPAGASPLDLAFSPHSDPLPVVRPPRSRFHPVPTRPVFSPPGHFEVLPESVVLPGPQIREPREPQIVEDPESSKPTQPSPEKRSEPRTLEMPEGKPHPVQPPSSIPSFPELDAPPGEAPAELPAPKNKTTEKPMAAPAIDSAPPEANSHTPRLTPPPAATEELPPPKLQKTNFVQAPSRTSYQGWQPRRDSVRPTSAKR